IHGFLKVDGEKMSKSQGTFVMASTYLKHLEPDCLRYFYASKLGPGLGDIDLNLEEFVNRVNSHLVGNIVNLASRSAKFVSGGTLCEKYPDDGGLFAAAAAKADQIAELYEQCDFSAAMLEVLQLADEANRFINDRAPWTLRKDPEKAEEVRQICSIVLNLFRQLTVFLKPVLPTLAEQSSALLNSPITNWNDVKTPLVGTPVSDFKHMMQRITNEQVEAMIDDSRVDDAAEDDSDDSDSPWKDGPEALAAEPLSEECTIDDFVKVDLRVARVIAAKDVPEANKLLNLTLSLGGGETRNVFAGIKAAYKPEDLLGRLVICVANLKPRQMKFGLSEGMICAAGPGKADVFLLGVDDGAVPGQRIH
ncbi:MAG: methionine--tRNA ligase subunit beta, partial [Planctomycetota bacterium]|nr:methionine--tRNA ligase subunit beta [Planctomycetota bacterium]